MFSAKERSSGKGRDLDLWRRVRKRLASKKGGEFRPRLSMRIWLTALFVLVTAFAAITAYQIVHPILYDTLNRLRERGEPVTEQRISAFARSHGLQWGIVRNEDGHQTHGNLDDWSPGPVKRAVEQPRRPSDDMEPVQTG